MLIISQYVVTLVAIRSSDWEFTNCLCSSPPKAKAAAVPATAQEIEETALQRAAILSNAATSVGSANDRVFASPLARSLARGKGLDISSWRGLGSGPQGRIVADDISAFPSGRPAASTNTAAAHEISSAHKTELATTTVT